MQSDVKIYALHFCAALSAMPYPSALANWIDTLPQDRQAAFTMREALDGTGMSHGAFLDAAGRMQRKGSLRRVRKGFYLPIRPVHRPHGSPFAVEYIDALMAHEGCEYYLAGLSAAGRHGAGYHAAGAMHVVASKRLPNLTIGETGIDFTYRSDFGPVRPFIEQSYAMRGEREMDRAPIKVSSPELTLLDLVAGVGAHDNNANVANMICRYLDPERLAACSALFPRAVVQRTGYLLDHEHAPFRRCAAALERALAPRKPRWVEFSRSWRRSPEQDDFLERYEPPADFADSWALGRPERNRRWRVIVRLPLEPDVLPGFFLRK